MVGFIELPAALVMKQRVEQLVVGDEEVHAAIQIVVRHAHPHSLAGMRAKTRGNGDVRKRAIAVVQE